MDTEQELVLKIRLEKLFRPAVVTLINQMIADYKASIITNGTPQNALLYKSRWQGIIDEHYRRTHRAFQKHSDRALNEQQKALLLTALMQWRTDTSDSSAQLITDTNQLQMAASVSNARTMFRESLGDDEERREPTQEELAQYGALDLRRRFNGRVSGIVSAETQTASEFYKFSEFSASLDYRPLAALAGAVFLPGHKTWRDVGDDRVRRAHREAHGQKVAASKPFIVDGEYLMHPGDRSRGASAKNVINCRCSALYTSAKQA